MHHYTRYLDPLLVEQLNHLQASARSVVEGATLGQHRSPLKGAGVEFRQHRFYVPGDEPRRLDWRVLARTNRPYVREYDEETNIRCALLLDCSGSMAFGGKDKPSKFDYAARFLVALAYLMLSQTESVGLALAAGEGLETFIAPHGGPHQLAHLIDRLERIGPRGPTCLGPAMHNLAERLERRAMVVVLSDFFQPLEALRPGLAHLRHQRHELALVRVLDRAEREFPFQHWVRFRGLEGEAPALCDSATVRRTYLSNFRRHARALGETCRALHAGFEELTSDQPLIESLRRVLRPA